MEDKGIQAIAKKVVVRIPDHLQGENS